MMIKQFWLFFIVFFISASNQAQNITALNRLPSFTLASPQLHLNKKIWVYLPYNYEKTHKRFPVLYMHDAQNLFDDKTAYAGEWNIDEKLDSLKAEIIVIGIEHGNENRITELTPFKNEKYGGGNASNYVDFIVETLKPEIDSRYRTKSNRKNTLMMGSSLGGLVTLYSGLKYPDVFGKLAVFSPSLWFSNKIFEAVSLSNKISSKIYLLSGDEEDDSMTTDSKKLESILISQRGFNDKNLKKEIIKHGKHNEKLWRDNFVTALLWLGY